MEERDEQLEAVREFKQAFEHLTRTKGWRKDAFSVLDDDDGFFVRVTLKWERPSEIKDQVL